MKYYKGVTEDDKIIGGGRYVDENGYGNEVCNFLPVDGIVYGFVRPTRGSQIHIESIPSIGNKEYKEKQSIEDVTVVWTAKRPIVGQVVVGWYRNATVYRRYQKFPDLDIPPIHAGNHIDGYWIKTRENDAILFPVDERETKIPHRQSNVRYVSSYKNEPEVIDKIFDLINGSKINSKKIGHKQIDQERKSRIEQEAISKVKSYYEKMKYSVESVEKDNCGWDLEATKEGITLKIEVKGLSGSTPSIELTPNEYKCFSGNGEDYRLSIVTNALNDPTLYICSYKSNKWVAYCNNKNMPIEVNIEERTGAKITLNKIN